MLEGGRKQRHQVGFKLPLDMEFCHAGRLSTGIIVSLGEWANKNITRFKWIIGNLGRMHY